MSRIDPIMQRLIGNENADDLATDILEVLTEGSSVPPVSYTHLTLPTRSYV